MDTEKQVPEVTPIPGAGIGAGEEEGLTSLSDDGNSSHSTSTEPTITVSTRGDGDGDPEAAPPSYSSVTAAAAAAEDAAYAAANSDLESFEKLAEIAAELKEHDVLDEELKQADGVKEEMEKELEENDGWVKILGNDSLMKKVITPGRPNVRPLRGDVCTIKIEGRLRDKEEVVFEQSHEMTVQLGDAEVIGGLDLAIPLMCKGETSTVSIAPRFGYGTIGTLPLVPPNAHLLYSIQLLDFAPEPELESLSVAQRRETGNRKRERGNWWYGRGEVSLAVQCYRRALEFLDEAEGGIALPKAEEDKKDALDLEAEDIKLLFEDRLKTYNNMAAAQLKLEAYGPALKSVEAVLRCQPTNVKALFRKGKILAQKGNTDEAITCFREAVRLEPENKTVIQELNRLSLKRKEERKNEKLLYKRMFNSANGNGDAKSSNPTDSKFGFKKSLNTAIVVGGVIVALAGVMAYRYGVS